MMIPAVAFRFKQLDLMPHHQPALGHLLSALQIPVPRRLPEGDSKTPEGEDVTTHFSLIRLSTDKVAIGYFGGRRPPQMVAISYFGGHSPPQMPSSMCIVK